MQGEENRTRSRGAFSPGLVIGPAFLLLAAWFVWDPVGVDIPSSEPKVIDPSRLSTEPRRAALGDPPKLHLGGFDRTCMDCHRLFPPRDDPPAQLLQHKHIKLEHGINDRCMNCHYESDRDRLVLHDGTVIGFGEVVHLCAKCHGPTFRDWENGAHGRTNGYWDASEGPIRRLKCTECHDPHMPRVPAMDPIAPLPGPNTLRMGPREPGHHGENGERRNPLHWRDSATSAGGHEATERNE